jgi:hypothetical protein
MEKRAGEKMVLCACEEQYPSAGQQNFADCFFLLWSKPIRQLFVGDILGRK